MPAAFIATALWLLTGRWRIRSLQLLVTIVAGGSRHRQDRIGQPEIRARYATWSIGVGDADIRALSRRIRADDVRPQMIVALVQWGITGLVVGRLTTRYSLMQTLGISIGSLFVVAAFTRLALRALGYQVIFEGP